MLILGATCRYKTSCKMHRVFTELIDALIGKAGIATQIFKVAGDNEATYHHQCRGKLFLLAGLDTV